PTVALTTLCPADRCGFQTRRIPEICRKPPPSRSVCARPCSSASRTSRPRISSLRTTSVNGNRAWTSRLVSGPAGTVRLVRMAPPFTSATSVPRRSRRTSVTRSPTLVSWVLSRLVRASSGTSVRPTTTSSSRSNRAAYARTSSSTEGSGATRRLTSRKRHGLLAGRQRGIEHDVRPWTRGARGVDHRETEEADAQASERHQVLGRGAAERPARAPVDDVGGQPAELRLVHALEEHGRPEIELVVPERRVVQSDRVEHGDYLGALEKGRLDRGRQEVAAQDEDGVRVLAPHLADQCRQARHSAAPASVHRSQHVVVVDLQERQPDQSRIAGWRAWRDA